MKYFKKNLSLVVSILLLLCIAFATGCEEDNPTEPADPTDNLLPGVSYMGHGYNVFGDYAKTEFVKSALFKYDSYQTVEVNGKSFNVPSDIEYIYVNTAEFKSISGINSHEYRERLGINASLSGSYSFFSMSVTSNRNGVNILFVRAISFSLSQTVAMVSRPSKHKSIRSQPSSSFEASKIFLYIQGFSLTHSNSFGSA